MNSTQAPVPPRAQGEKGKKGNRLLLLLAVLLLLVLAALVALLVRGGGSRLGSEMEPNAVVGQMPGKTEEQIKAELEQRVAENMIALTINSNPIFANGEAEGDILFENPVSNGKLTRMELYLDAADPYAETLGEDALLYKTGLLEPGSYVPTATLLQSLPKGSYSCTAYIYGYKTGSQEYIGKVAAGVTLTVEN